jgi:hypothetical protein
MRSAAATVVSVTTLVGLVALLMREGTQFWHLAAVAAATGAAHSYPSPYDSRWR